MSPSKLPWLALLGLLGLAAALAWRPAVSAPASSSAHSPTPPRGFGDSAAPLADLGRPALDLRAPARVETATFALG